MVNRGSLSVNNLLEELTLEVGGAVRSLQKAKKLRSFRGVVTKAL
jgi:hypothetical protein